MDDFCKRMKIEQRVTAAYNPHVNGQNEQFNYELVDILRKMCADNKLIWDLKLYSVVYFYNMKIHSSTRFSPFEISFGRKPNNFSTTAVEDPNNRAELMQRCGEIKEFRENTIPQAVKNIIKNQEKQIDSQNKQQSISEKEYKVGDFFNKKRETIDGKLEDKYKGPYEIVGKTKTGGYL